MKGFFVTGTDTAVGKTEIAAYLARSFSKKGLKVGVMKPIATGVSKICEDAKILKEASSSKERLEDINPVTLKPPLAPLVGSKVEKKRINLETVWKSFARLKRNSDILIVEGIGGLMVPICVSGKKIFYVVDMILKMKLPVIVVSRPDLGTINHTLLTVKALKDKRIKIKGIIINYAANVKGDPSIKTNPLMIEKLTGVPLLGIMRHNKDKNKRRIKWLKKIKF